MKADSIMSRTAIGFVLAPLLGLAALIVPIVVSSDVRHYEAPLFPLLRDAVEGVGPLTLVLLFVSGLILGAVSSSRAWLLSVTAIVALPITAIAEMIKDPTSHNLFPLEFATYAFYGALFGLGIVVIRRIRNWPAIAKRTH